MPARQPGAHRTALPGPASLARLIKDRRDGDDLRIVGALDVGGLKYHIERAEREDAGERDDQ